MSAPVCYLLHFERPYKHAKHYTGKPESSGFLRVRFAVFGRELAELSCGLFLSLQVTTWVVLCPNLGRGLLPASGSSGWPVASGEDEPGLAVDEFTGGVQVAGVAGGLSDHVQQDLPQVVQVEAGREEVRPPGRRGFQRGGGDDLVGQLYL